MFVVGALFFVFAPLPVHAEERPDTAPRIVNWNFEWSIESDAIAEKLSQWDIVLLDIENERFSRARMKLIKELNPDIKLYAYISLSDIRPDASSLADGTARQYIGEQLEANPDWVLKLADGSAAEWWPTYNIMNVTNSAPKVNGERFNDFYANFIRDAVIKDTIWDGVFFDNLWENITFVSENVDLNNDGKKDGKVTANKAWRKGVRKILKRAKSDAKKLRKSKFKVTGNGGARQYKKQVNGIGFEHFPKTLYGGWTDSMEEYFQVMRLTARDSVGIVNSNVQNTGNRTNYQKFRYGLASTLMNDGYYSFDNGDATHRERWYYDEYNVALGDPVSGAYNTLRSDDPRTLRDGVWRRDYELASVFVNSTDQAQTVTLNSGFERLLGEQDASTNSGELTGQITLQPHDGIILLRRLQQVQDATFINGAFSKVFDENGEQVRHSFFAFDGSFAGGQQIHRVSRSGKTVVADSSRVRVYNRQNREIASFAPYGSDFSSGVNIAVGALFGGQKSYIVTGPQNGGAHVRIFDMKGQVVNPGCFPYPDGFKGGVNVSVGDLNGDNRLEIVVAAGFGGGPHIRILNNNCEVINPGFFAFDQSLRIGVNMAVGDLNGDGKAEIIAASGPGGGPHVRIFNKNGKMLSAGFFAYSTSDRSGVLVSTADIDQDGDDEIVTNSFSIFNPF